MYKLYIRFFILLSVTLSVALGCASLSSPQGGPRDSLPPRVIASTPLPYSVNFKGKKITLEFDEYIQLKDQQKLFFVSPEAKQKPILAIKGRSVSATFQDSLAPETTYRLDFGGSIADNNEGNKLDNFSFVFSTGSYIDSLLMVGQVLDARTGDTVIGAFIDYFDVEADSTFAFRGLDSTLFKSRADAMFRSDSSGYFVADILKEKPYRVYSIMDKNGNQRYEAGTDLVGFLDSTYNPAQMHGFSFEYDSTKRRTYIDSLQLKFHMFEEKPSKRQTLSSHSRFGRNKLSLFFNAHEAQYDSLVLDSIPQEWLITERGMFGDSITLWVAPPTIEQYKALKDTIKGSMVYKQQDSVWKYHSKKAELKFINVTYTKKEPKKSKKELERELEAAQRGEVDSVAAPEKPKEKEPNPFHFEVLASTDLNPEHGIGFLFDYPLRTLDSARIELTRIEQADESAAGGGARRGALPTIKKEGKPVPEKFTVHRPSTREIVINAPWKTGTEYKLVIPSGVFEDIAFQSNDTLSSTFKTLDPDKFGTITADITADTTLTGKYIVDLLLLNGNNIKTIQRRVGVHAGDKLDFKFLRPEKYVIRITEDTDGNNEWTTGDLIRRVQPERVRTYRNATGSRDVIAKENWTIVEHIELGDLFKSK